MAKEKKDKALDVEKSKTDDVIDNAEAPADKKPVKKEASPDLPSAASADEETLNLSVTAKELIEKIEMMSVLELNNLVKALEKKFGVSASAPVAASAAIAGNADDTETEEKTSFDVVLTNMGSNKLSVIKAVRQIKPDLGLKDAKELVESAPKVVLESVKKEEAETAKAKLEEAGATIELK
jgi:large subunit ribosomal protein L7/L12